MADDRWGDKYVRALGGLAGGVMGEMYSQNKRDLMAEAEITRQENLNRLRSDDAYQNSASGFVDKQGMPINRNRLSDHKGDKSSQYDWNKNAAKEATLAATANKYAATQSPAGLAMAKAEQDKLEAKSTFERGKADRAATRKSDAAVALEAQKGVNARLMKSLDKGSLSTKDKMKYYQEQIDADTLINDASSGILSGKDKTTKQVEEDAIAKVDKMIEVAGGSKRDSKESSKDRNIRMSGAVDALLKGDVPTGDFTEAERKLITDKATSLMKPTALQGAPDTYGDYDSGEWPGLKEGHTINAKGDIISSRGARMALETAKYKAYLQSLEKQGVQAKPLSPALQAQKDAIMGKL